MKKYASKIFIVILFLAGLSLLLYPFIADRWNSYRQQRLMSNYDQVVAEKEAAGLIDYNQEWELAEAYNRGLLPSILPDAFAEAEVSKANGEDEAYQLCLNITGNGMMGTVERKRRWRERRDIWREAPFRSAGKIPTRLSLPTEDCRAPSYLRTWTR